MSTDELCNFMLHSKIWRVKERLFHEAFPDAQDRVRFYGDFAGRLASQSGLAGKNPEYCNALAIRKLAIEEWFALIPQSVLHGVDLNDPAWADPLPAIPFDEMGEKHV